MILAVGMATMLSGIILVLRHLHVWRQQVDADPPRDMRSFLGKQLRRRTLTSSCIAVLGFTIAALHFTDFWRQRPGGYAILISCAMTLIFMILVLAMLDFAASTSALRSQKEETRRAAEAMAQEYVRLRAKQRLMTGDRPPSNDSTTDS
jgi:uncharacterized membrane protein